MKIWPASTFEIRSSLTPETAIAALEVNVEPWKWMHFYGNHRYFQGTISGRTFKIIRIPPNIAPLIKYKNPFRPIISGDVSPTENGSIVKISLRLHSALKAFDVFWFSGVFLICALMVEIEIAYLLGANIPPPSTASQPGWAPHVIAIVSILFIPCSGIAMVAGGFWSEAKAQRKKLEEIFQIAGSKQSFQGKI